MQSEQQVIQGIAMVLRNMERHAKGIDTTRAHISDIQRMNTQFVPGTFESLNAEVATLQRLYVGDIQDIKEELQKLVKDEDAIRAIMGGK